MRPINADNIKLKLTNLVTEMGPTITDAEFLKLLLRCVDNEPMCNLNEMEDIIKYYKNK